MTKPKFKTKYETVYGNKYSFLQYSFGKYKLVIAKAPSYKRYVWLYKKGSSNHPESYLLENRDEAFEMANALINREKKVKVLDLLGINKKL